MNRLGGTHSLILMALVIIFPIIVQAEPVSTSVLWVDDANEGTAEFQGVLEDQSLTGSLDFGGERLVVDGDVDQEGAIAGEVKTEAGSVVLTFGTTSLGGEVEGEFAGAATEGIWATQTSEPAQGIPDVPD